MKEPAKKRTYFVEFTFDFWEILYTEEGVMEGSYEKVFHTGRGSNIDRLGAHQMLDWLIEKGDFPKGHIIRC